jgi:hypothetical protein
MKSPEQRNPKVWQLPCPAVFVEEDLLPSNPQHPSIDVGATITLIQRWVNYALRLVLCGNGIILRQRERIQK